MGKFRELYEKTINNVNEKSSSVADIFKNIPIKVTIYVNGDKDLLDKNFSNVKKPMFKSVNADFVITDINSNLKDVFSIIDNKIKKSEATLVKVTID